jgi:hopene-associated glycosyltransferase HpnB
VPLSPTLVAAIPLAIWIYLFFARGNFWQLREDNSQPQPLASWPRVVAVVPARNEAKTIAQTVSALCKQDFPGEFSIVVVDDHSEDGTATIARKAAEKSGAPGRIAIHSASDLPPGWTGKLWALNEGVQAASDGKPDFLWFTDADIEHAPDTLKRLVFRAEKDSLDLASLMVLLQAKTFPERLLIPPFLYFFLMLYPPRWIADPNANTAGAAGGCILLRRNVLAPIGGIASIRGEVIDDCALARAVKSRGGRIWMGLTRASVSLRRQLRGNSRHGRAHCVYAASLLVGPIDGHAGRAFCNPSIGLDSFFRLSGRSLAPCGHCHCSNDRVLSRDCAVL